MRTTSPKASVAIARYTPDSRNVGRPMAKAIAAGAAMPAPSTAANGQPKFIVSSAEA